MGQSQSQIE
jgi:hypothetical protein